MLGEQIGEFRGKVTGMRVLPGDDFRYVKIEQSWQGGGKLLGADAMDIGTMTILERVPGQQYASGQGIVEAAGGEGAIWSGSGIGRMAGEGMATSVRFSCTFQASTTGKLARLNAVVVVGEMEIDADSNYTSKLWEWK